MQVRSAVLSSKCSYDEILSQFRIVYAFVTRIKIDTARVERAVTAKCTKGFHGTTKFDSPHCDPESPTI